MENQARESGEILDGRWVVFGSGRTSLGDVAFVRDQRWKNVKRVLVPRQRTWDEQIFAERTALWRDHGAHPRLVAGYHTMDIDGWPHFVTDFVSTPTLADRLKSGANVFPPKVALALVVQIAAGLVHMHEAGWAHGDLQPETCLLVDREEVRLTGFWLGGARNLLDRQRQPYWAPECYADPASPPTPAGDVYALGVILYQLLVGHPPFGSDPDTLTRWNGLVSKASGWNRLVSMLPFGDANLPRLSPELAKLLSSKKFPPEKRADLMRALHQGAPLHFFAEDPQIAPELQEILTACLAKSPERRPKIAALHAHLVARARALGLKVGDDHKATPDENDLNARGVAYAEMGELDRAAALFDGWLEEHPLSPYVWANRKILELYADPSALPRIVEEFDAEIRSQPGATVDQARVGEILEFFTRDLLYLRGGVRSISLLPDGSRVALAGRFVGGVRLWEVGEGGSTSPLKGGSGRACQYVFLHPAGRILVEAADDLLQAVEIESGDVRWTKRFPGEAVDARCSPSGSWTAVCVPGRVVLMQTATGQLKDWLSFEGDAPLSRARWRPDERALAVCSGSEILVCDLLDRGKVTRIGGFEGPIRDLCFTPDGERLLVADGSATAVLIDPSDGRRLLSLAGHEEPITCLAIDADGRRALTGSKDQTARLWSLDDGSERRTLFGGKAAMTQVAFWPDGSRMVVGDAKGGVRLWDAEPELGRFFVGTPTTAEASTLHRNVREQSLLLHDRGSATGFVLSVLGARIDWSHRYDAPVGTVAFGPNSELVVAGLPHATYVSQVSGRAVHVDAMQLHHDAQVFDVAFSPDGTHIVVGAGRGEEDEPPPQLDGAPSAWLRAINSSMERAFLVGPGGLTIGRSSHRDAVIDDLGVSRHHCTIRMEGGKFIIKDEGSANGIFVNSVRLWEATLEEGDEIQIGATTLKFSLVTQQVEEPTTNLIELADLSDPSAVKWEDVASMTSEAITGIHRSNVAVIWRVADGRAVRELAGHATPIRAVAYTPDGANVVTGSEDGLIVLWDPVSGRSVRTFMLKGAQPEGTGVTSVAVSPDSRWILAGYGDGCARLWHRETGRPFRLFTGHNRGITAVAFSADGRRLLTGSSDGTAILWNTRTGDQVTRFAGHTGPITAVGFSPDDHVVLTGSQDGTAKLWSRISHKELYTVEIKAEGVNSVHFSPDGRMLVAGGADGTVQVWLMRWFWAFLDDALVVLEKILDNQAAQTMFWQREETEGDLDYWLDIWADLKHCASGETPRDPERLAKVRTRLQYTLLDLVRRAGTTSKTKRVVPLGLDAVRAASTMPEDPDKLLASGMYAVECVDPELAERFKA